MAGCIRTSDVVGARCLQLSRCERLRRAALLHLTIEAERTAVVWRLFGMVGLTLEAAIHALIEFGLRHLVGRVAVDGLGGRRCGLGSAPVCRGDGRLRFVGWLLTARALTIGATSQPQRGEPQEQAAAWSAPRVTPQRLAALQRCGEGPANTCAVDSSHVPYSRTPASRTRGVSLALGVLRRAYSRKNALGSAGFGVQRQERLFAFAM